MTADNELRRLRLAEITAKREAAAQARRLADYLWSDEDRDRALRFAEETEAEANQLERALAAEGACGSG